MSNRIVEEVPTDAAGSGGRTCTHQDMKGGLRVALGAHTARGRTYTLLRQSGPD